MTRKGIWIDDPPSMVAKPPYWDELKRHGISTVGIMLESIGNGFNPMYSEADLIGIRGMALSRDIEVALTVWPEPNKQYLDELRAEIGKYIVASGAAALEFDAESNWIPKKVVGFANLHAASEYLAQIMQELRDKYHVRIELTTFTEHTENSAKADLATHVDRLLPQAYSVRNRSDGVVAWTDKYGPGNMQRRTLDNAKQVKGTHKLCCGLAAYDQTWDTHTALQAMQTAWDAATAYGVEEVRFWSSKWVIGIKKNGYASQFLLSLVGK